MLNLVAKPPRSKLSDSKYLPLPGSVLGILKNTLGYFSPVRISMGQYHYDYTCMQTSTLVRKTLRWGSVNNNYLDIDEGMFSTMSSSILSCERSFKYPAYNPKVRGTLCAGWGMLAQGQRS